MNESIKIRRVNIHEMTEIMKKIKIFIILNMMLLSLITIILMIVEFLRASRILESIPYQPTEYYYLVTDNGYYAGNRKGVALFTDDCNGAIRFSPEIVNGKMDIFTGISWVESMNDVLNNHPEAEFVKEKEIVEEYIN